ncbi:MAG: class I SAM-dependent methyltransferase, partial [Candidatus Rokuibacteriota bacterium]
ERRAGEIERLGIQGEAMAPDAAIMLDRIGVGSGWRCLDLGCGPGGITDLLSARVGPTGRVVGLDADPVFLGYARERARERGLSNVEFVRGDAYRTGLPRGSFDLVHVRFVAGTAGEPAGLLQEAIRLTRPGGFVGFQEADISTLNCYPPHPAWDRLKGALEQAFVCVGADVRLAQRLYQLVRNAGLEDVHYRPFMVGIRSGDPMTDYLPATVESVRGTLLDKRLIAPNELEAALAACRAHLADPDTVFTTYTVAQVWGRAPGPGAAQP